MIKRVYFIGIGGIGMSAIARFFINEGAIVGGYDRTATPITSQLIDAGALLCFTDSVEAIPQPFIEDTSTLVIYTPAIPSNHPQLRYFIERGTTVVKRSQALGELTKGKFVMAVAGTHGKSSTSTLVAYLNHKASNNGGGSAFLGAISKNFDSNLVLGAGARVTVEADEFDRSFLQLQPAIALITSVDADHLDIYGTHDELLKSFSLFIERIRPQGVAILRYGIKLNITREDIKLYSYSLNECEADFYAKNITCNSDGIYTFDIVCPDRVIRQCRLGIAGRINVENAVGAVAMMWCAGFNEEALINALSSFRGLKRRFDVRISTPELVYIDDYAHHPSELNATIQSIREIYPKKRITALFQPHLYSRTRDFADGFAEALSKVDSVTLLPIYPAREEPIEGVSSEIIFDKITLDDKKIISKDKIIEHLKGENPEILITFGAGDIDTLCDPIEEMFRERV